MTRGPQFEPATTPVRFPASVSPRRDILRPIVVVSSSSTSRRARPIEEFAPPPPHLGRGKPHRIQCSIRESPLRKLLFRWLRAPDHRRWLVAATAPKNRLRAYASFQD